MGSFSPCTTTLSSLCFSSLKSSGDCLLLLIILPPYSPELFPHFQSFPLLNVASVLTGPCAIWLEGGCQGPFLLPQLWMRAGSPWAEWQCLLCPGCYDKIPKTGWLINKRPGSSVGVSFIRSLSPGIGLYPHHLGTSQRPYLLIPSAWALRFQHMNLKGTQTLGP